MLMFQNGLLATFIPDILMVIGYLMCLIAPHLKTQNSQIEQTQVITIVSTVEHQQLSIYHVTIADFQQYAESISDVKPVISYFTIVIKIFETTFSTFDDLSYVDFSRPPPTFLS